MSQLLQIIWDPSLGIHIGSFILRYYSLTYVIAFGLGFYLMDIIFKTDKEDKKMLDPLFMYMFLAVILGARLGHVLFYQKELFVQDPLSIFLPIRTQPHFEFTGFQGLASHGAAIAVLISLYIFTKKYLHKSYFWILDRITIPVAIGGMFIRLGNFFNSEILGKPSDLPWAVLFIQQDTNEYGAIISRHPAQVYEALGYLILFLMLIFIYFKTNKKKQLGWLFGFFLIVLFGIRFIVEFFKEPQGEEYINWFGFNTGQWLSIPFVLVGIIILATSKNRVQYSKKTKK